MKKFPHSLLEHFFFCIDILSRLDDPCVSVRGLAIECLSQIDANRNDSNFSEASYSNLAETVISRLFLYFDDPFIKLRPILLGEKMHMLFAYRSWKTFFQSFLLFFFTFLHFRCACKTKGEAPSSI